MHKIIKHLHNDHHNMKKLLMLMEHQLQQIEGGDTPDIDLMQDILDYLINITDKLHHPIEDHIYNIVKKRLSPTDKSLESILVEHEKLSRMTHSMANTLNEIVFDAVIPREDVIKEIKDYIDTNLRHIEQESNIIFPKFNQLLDDNDWSEIEHAIYEGTPPLYDPQVEQQFIKLFNSIMESTSH